MACNIFRKKRVVKEQIDGDKIYVKSRVGGGETGFVIKKGHFYEEWPFCCLLIAVLPELLGFLP